MGLQCGYLWKHVSRIIHPPAPGYSSPADEDGQSFWRNRSNSIQSKSIHWINVFQVVMFQIIFCLFICLCLIIWKKNRHPLSPLNRDVLYGPPLLRKFQQHERQIVAKERFISTTCFADLMPRTFSFYFYHTKIHMTW